MPTTIEEAQRLERVAEANDGHCDQCGQTIKIYHYTVNKPAATFMRALADAVRNSNVNDTDISTIGLPYSVRTQVTKLRLHGLIARVKDDRGVQNPRHWLVTHKGWGFINGKPIPKQVTVYNNQVLGHGEGLTTIHTILGEKFDPQQPVYAETPVSPAESRTYADVRTPKKMTTLQAVFKGSKYHTGLNVGEVYELHIDRLAMSKPINVEVAGNERQYKDIAAFQKDWKVA